MEFEQLALNDALIGHVREVSDISCRKLDDDGRVYAKIDWLTVMFFDCSLQHVLDWIQLGDCVSDFCADVYEQARGYDNVFKFRYEGIMLETSSFSYYGIEQDERLFDLIVPKIRLELSGSALDYLRSIGLNMDTYRFQSPVLPEGGSYHFTRCDFAFDFVNYQPRFLDALIDHINVHQLPSGRVPLASTKGAIGYRIVTGGQKTVYLGSPQADKMLRVYDKRLQYVNQLTDTYIKENPYSDPDSWIRIEWQTRNKVANNLVLDSALEFKHILKMIFEAYSFADGTQDNHNVSRSVVPFWLNLFPWQEIESRLVQNSNFVQYESPDVKVINRFEQNIRSFIFYYSLVGKQRLTECCNQYLRSLEKNDPVSKRRLLAFTNKLNQLSFVHELSGDRDFGLFNNSGRLYFKL